jgi:hypothetical protein
MSASTPPPSAGSAASTLPGEVPAVRSCTRCDGEQHLVQSVQGFGKFRCLNCGMVVGFDLEADPSEFLIDRGAPGRYTQDVFGSRLLPMEQRLS